MEPTRMVQINRTIRSKMECQAVAQYLVEKHKGSGGFGVLQKAVSTGDTVYLQDWMDSYGHDAIWRQAHGWLRKWRLKEAGNQETTISIKTTTRDRLKEIHSKTGRSYDQIITDLLNA